MAPRSSARASVQRSTSAQKEVGREVDLRKVFIDEGREYLDIAERQKNDADPVAMMIAMARAAQLIECIKYLDKGQWDDGDENLFAREGLAELEEQLDELDAESED